MPVILRLTLTRKRGCRNDVSSFGIEAGKRGRLELIRVSIALIVLLTPLFGCSKQADGDGGQGGAGKQPSLQFPVEVEPVQVAPVEYTVSAVGSVEAFERVEVTSRVAGAVESVRFSEGQFVRRGERLVEIDPQRFRLAVSAAEATLQKQRAALSEAQISLARRESVNAKSPGLIRGEEVEIWRTRAQTAAAEVAQAETALEQARLNLNDAFVAAPVSGVIQTRTVQTGQYVPVGTMLATLVRRDPLLLRFQLPEQDSVRVRPGMRSTFHVSEDPYAYSAVITHVAESASTDSRMVAVTAHVNDAKRNALKAGSFARVTIPIGGTASAPVIPQTAIRPSERGFLAFVVENGEAKERILTLGMRTAEGRVEVRAGLRPGEQLVVRGAEALKNGSKVKVSG